MIEDEATFRVRRALEETPNKIDLLYNLIMNLTIKEQRELLARLGGDDPDAGVREPHRPLRPSSSGAVALEVEEQDPWVMPKDTQFGA